MEQIPSSPPSVTVGEFEGPLDLLLNEVTRQRVAIKDISLAPLAARLLGYMRTAAKSNFQLNMEWLHMAATLIHWKSRALLPVEPSAKPAHDSVRDELIGQLLAHQKLLAGELGHRHREESNRFSRPGNIAGSGEAQAETNLQPPIESVWDLMQQAKEIACWVSSHRDAQRLWQDTWAVEAEAASVGEMSEWLRMEMASSAGRPLNAEELLNLHPASAQRNCLFLAMLELAGRHEIELEQRESFGPISLKTK